MMFKELRSQHRNIVQMSFNGFKNTEIAEKTELSLATVSNVLRSPLGKAYLNGLIDRAQENTLDVRKKLISLNKDAINTIERILDPKVKAPFNVQLTAAKDVLDRNGYKPSDKFEIDVFSHKTDDEIEAEIRAMEAAIARNQLTNENTSATKPLSETFFRKTSDLTDNSLLGAQEGSSPGESAENGQSAIPQSETSLDVFQASASATASKAQPQSKSQYQSQLQTQAQSQVQPQAQPQPQPQFQSQSSNLSQSFNVSNLPNDIQAKLNDQSFDPFRNI